jgi:cytochrome oxidase assembly protein ShyY1
VFTDGNIWQVKRKMRREDVIKKLEYLADSEKVKLKREKFGINDF